MNPSGKSFAWSV